MVPSARTDSTEHQLEHRRSQPNTRQHFLAVQVTEHWHWLPREAVQPPALEIFESHLDVVLGHVAGCPCSAGVEPEGLHRALPTILGFLTIMLLETIMLKGI